MDKLVSNNNPQYTYDISYGKAHVPLYRVYATPLTGITPIPESAFTGRDNTLFALEVDIEVFSQHVLPAYTHGDNTQVVATDSMKNFVLRHALTFNGSTLESFLASLGRQFLTTYPQMQSIRLTARELPFATVPVPQFATATFAASNVLYKRSHDDFAIAQIDFSLDGDTVAITDHRCGRLDLQLLKVTGSSFTRFVQDGYTTLPERSDRPLFIYLDVYWRYANVASMLTSDLAQYVAAEQVRDVVQVVFHEFVSESIQHLVHEIGLRLLERFPQLAEVSFEAQNRTRDPMFTSDSDDRVKVYSDPFPAYGSIKLTLKRAV
ncbi:MAG TPA: urate oxidase [Ktedonobacteraceae bacterium]|nr:urate oxidase [Ktedonobacteraceae bacterium]